MRKTWNMCWMNTDKKHESFAEEKKNSSHQTELWRRLSADSHDYGAITNTTYPL